MTFSDGDTKREVVPGIHKDILNSKTHFRNQFCPPRLQWPWWLKWRLWWGEGAAPEVTMPQIGKEISLAKPHQLPAGPRKKRPLGRLFSSVIYMMMEKDCDTCPQRSLLTGSFKDLCEPICLDIWQFIKDSCWINKILDCEITTCVLSTRRNKQVQKVYNIVQHVQHVCLDED